MASLLTPKECYGSGKDKFHFLKPNSLQSTVCNRIFFDLAGIPCVKKTVCKEVREVKADELCKICLGAMVAER